MIQEKKSSVSLIIFVLLIAVMGGAFYFYTRTPEVPLATSSERKAANQEVIPPAERKARLYGNKKEPTVVKEELKIPVTKRVTVTSGGVVESSEDRVDVPLVPQGQGEIVVVPLATYTVKGTYNLSAKEAKLWRSDAKLSFIKSLGAITLEGKSSQWQAVFVSPGVSRKAYEIIIQGDAVVSKKEVESATTGADMPKSWFDSDEALKRLAAMPQFANATVSSINFYYSVDAKAWGYAFGTSLGTTSLEV